MKTKSENAQSAGSIYSWWTR